MIWAASKVRTQLFHASPSPSKACFKPLNIFEQNLTNLSLNHSRIFPINMGSCLLHWLSLKNPKIFVALLNETSKNRGSCFHFHSISTPNNHPETSPTSIQTFQSPNSSSPSLIWVEPSRRNTSLSWFWSCSYLHLHHPNKFPFTLKCSYDHLPQAFSFDCPISSI